ncbi:MAG: lipopolysaccharide assembly protein LapA domain-containing protein [Pseudomonadota bacterium]
MYYVGWAVKILIFLAVLGFALQNSQPVTLHYFFGYVWEAPLVALLLAAFTLGAFLGVLALLPTLFRLRGERTKLRRELDSMIDANTTTPALGADRS